MSDTDSAEVGAGVACAAPSDEQVRDALPEWRELIDYMTRSQSPNKYAAFMDLCRALFAALAKNDGVLAGVREFVAAREEWARTWTEPEHERYVAAVAALEALAEADS